MRSDLAPGLAGDGTSATILEEAMTALSQLLEERAYAQLYSLLAGAGLFPTDLHQARRVIDSLAEADRAVLSCFGLGLPIRPHTLGARASELCELLCAVGLLEQLGDEVRTTSLVIVPILGGHLLTAIPPGHETARANASRGRAYLGPDSLTLARALPDARGRRVLDLGTGCGIQGLLAVRGAVAVTCSDIEARSLELVTANALLNRVEAEVRVLAGDTYEPVSDERFDLICALPPYVPSLPGYEDAATAGGPDGLQVLTRVLEGASAHLHPGGELVCYAQLLCDDDGPLLERQLPEDLGGELRIALGAWHPLQPYALELAQRHGTHSGNDVAPLLASYQESLRALGVTGVASAFVRLRARPQASHPSPRTRTRLPALCASDRFVAAGTLRFARDDSLRSVTCSNGASQLLASASAALLAAFEHGATIEHAAERAWGRGSDATVLDLLDQAIQRSIELERAGFLLRAREP